MKTQPATGETYPKSDLFNKAHVDIMDGNYVRNITLSPFFIENLKKITTVPIDVHLMVNHPEDIIPMCLEAG
ncbi:hypothetical protein ACXYTC_18945, partial [Escherichia coli]